MKMPLGEERHYRVLLSPVVSEKATALSEGSLGCGQSFVFNVARDATKPQVSAAVEKAFAVKVDSVRIQNLKGKARNMRHRGGGNRRGRRPLQRRAMVRLAEGHDIDFLKLGGGAA